MPYTISVVAAPTSGTTPVAQAISLSCHGHTPKAVLVLATRATSLDTITSGAMESAAVWDGTTVRLGSAMSEDGQLATAADSGMDYDNNQIVRILTTGSEATDGVANAVSLAADTLNISWSDLPSTATYIVVVAFYGSRMSAATFSLTCNTADAGTASITGLSFRPRALITIGALTNFVQSGANADMRFGLGALNEDGSVQGQAAYALREADRAATTACASQLRDDSICTRSTLTAEEATYELTSGAADGFTVTTHLVGGAVSHAIAGIALAVEGGDTAVDVVDVGTDSTGEKTVGGGSLPGKPGLIMVLGTALGTANTLTTAAPCGNWSLGGAVIAHPGHALQNASIGYGATDNAVTSATHCVTSSTHCAWVPADTSGTDWAGFIPRATHGSFTLDVTVQSAASRLLAYLWIEEPSDIGWLAEARSGSRWRRQLARM